MSDPQEPRMGGVRVYRTSLAPECDGYGYFEGDGSEFPNTPAEPGTWFPLAEAEALEAVEVAASVGRRDGWGAQAQYDMARALSVLHNLRNAALRRKS